MSFLSIKLENTDKKDYFLRLKDIYGEMAKRYSIVSDAIDFNCSSCNDNCCYTHFKHHTIIEYLYLMEGLSLLDEVVRDEVVEKSKEVAKETMLAEDEGRKIRIMCPLNKDGLCIMYEHRLMICRLHGTAHYFDTPKGRMSGPGCYRFEDLSMGKKSIPMLDRTDIYRDLAMLEMAVRKKTGINFKFKNSIAEMIAQSY